MYVQCSKINLKVSSHVLSFSNVAHDYRVHHLPPSQMTHPGYQMGSINHLLT